MTPRKQCLPDNETAKYVKSETVAAQVQARQDPIAERGEVNTGSLSNQEVDDTYLQRKDYFFPNGVSLGTLTSRYTHGQQ